MKKAILFFLFISILSLTSEGQVRSNKDIIGKWEANELKFEFFPDGRVTLLMRGGTMPGATYKTDFLKTPASLNITVTQDRKKMVFNALIRFIDNTTVEMQGYDDNDPAAAFMKGRTVKLKKTR